MVEKADVIPLTGVATLTMNDLLSLLEKRKLRESKMSWQLATWKLLGEQGLPLTLDGWPDPRYSLVINTFYAESGDEVYEYRWRKRPAA